MPRSGSTSWRRSGSGLIGALPGSGSTSHTRWPRTSPTRSASQPNLDRALPDDGTNPLYDRDEVHEIYRAWRHVFNEYDPPLMGVAETWYPPSKRTRLYARPTELGQVFDFALLKSAWDAERVPTHHPDTPSTTTATTSAKVADSPGCCPATTSPDTPHDSPCPQGSTRTPGSSATEPIPAIDPQLGIARARAASLMMLALPGSAYLYQGEELGLPEVADLSTLVLHDPVWTRSSNTLKGRDGCRVPLPWTRTGPSFGFGSDSAWLPQPATWGDLSVEAQSGKNGSTLELYRKALAIRRASTALAGFDFTWRTPLQASWPSIEPTASAAP